MNRNFDFDFSKLKNRRNVKRIYKDTVFKYISSNKDKVFSIIDEHGDISHHTFSMVEMHFIRNPIKSALRKEDTIYIECMPNKAKERNKYIVVNKKIKGCRS